MGIKKSLFLFIICSLLVFFQNEGRGEDHVLHTVEAKQTLYSISKKYNVSLKKIISVNNLKNTTLREGQILKIPNEKSERSSQIHIVQKGETVYSISNKYGISIKDFFRLNPKKTTLLKLGEKVNVYDLKQKPMKKTEVNKEIILSFDGELLAVRKIQAQETFFRIVSELGYEEEEIQEINQHVDPTNLEVGDYLFYYSLAETIKENANLKREIITHEVKKGETLYSIAKKYFTTIRHIVSVNKIKNNKIKKGRVLNIIKYEIKKHEPFSSEEEAKEEKTAELPSHNKYQNIVFEENECTDLLSSKTNFTIVALFPFHENLESVRVATRKEQMRLNRLKKQSILSIDLALAATYSASKISTAEKKITLHFFDTKGSQFVIQKLLLNPVVRNADLIIGPLSSSKLSLLKDISTSEKIPVVFPIPTEKSYFEDFPYLFRSIPPVSEEVTRLLDYVLTYKYDEHLLLLTAPKGRSKLSLQTKEALTLLSDVSDIQECSPDEISVLLSDSIINREKPFWFFIPTNYKPHISHAVNRISGWTDSIQTKVFTTQGVLGSDVIDIETIKGINTHFSVGYNIDYSSLEIQEEEKMFSKMFYGKVPSKNSLIGVSIFDFFFHNLLLYGKSFYTCSGALQKEGNIISFNFEKSMEENLQSEFVNRSINIKKLDEEFSLQDP